ncbi:MAG: hypothetical protein ACLUI3_00065 [Christensenellales bacterium]|nr:MAG TPA: hypothetical protein [Caudoviricetes sp.]
MAGGCFAAVRVFFAFAGNGLRGWASALRRFAARYALSVSARRL